MDSHAEDHVGKTTINFFGPLAGFGNAVLRMGGMQGSRPMPKPGTPPPQKISGPALNMKLWLGARLPFFAFCTIAGAFTFAYHMFPMLPWALFFFFLNFGVLGTWPSKSIGTKRRTMWDWAPMMSWLLAVCSAGLLGHINYSIIDAWVNTTFLREYDNVHSNTDPRSVMDGGILNFDASTSLGTSLSAGYKHWLETFCAAPIVRAGEPDSAPIGFWAVGKGCCNARGDFTCKGAGDAHARTGLPLSRHSLDPWTAEGYKKAAGMVAASNGLAMADEPIFVMWVQDAHHVGKTAWWTATIVFFAAVLVGLFSCCACQMGFQHISEMEQCPSLGASW